MSVYKQCQTSLMVPLLACIVSFTSSFLIMEILETGNEEKIDRTIKRQCDFDPDIWVIEIDDPKGKKILSEFDEC